MGCVKATNNDVYDNTRPILSYFKSILVCFLFLFKDPL